MSATKPQTNQQINTSTNQHLNKFYPNPTQPAAATNQ
jgi:hypothetical protein